MKHLRIFRTIFFAVAIIFLTNLLIYAQCEGVYFKTIYRQIFSERVNFSTGLYEDLTGDGKIDLIGYGFENNSTAITKLYISKNDGNGSFSSPSEVFLPTQTHFGGIEIVDYDSDGSKDLAAKLETNPQSILIYKNNGTGDFSPLIITQLALGDFIFNIIDINNDNLTDLLIGNNVQLQGIKNYYRLGQANGTFGNRVEIPFADYATAADFNNDGKVDFPTISGSSPNYIMRIYYNQGNGAFLPGSNSINIGKGGLRAAKDFNNDGKTDLIAVSIPDKVSIIKNLGNDSFSKTEYALPPITTSGASFGSPAFGDFNGDGFLDFTGVASQTPPYFSIFTNDGTGNFTRRDYNNRNRGFPFGNFNNDGKTDLLKSIDFSLFNQDRIFNETIISIEENVCEPQGKNKIVDFDNDNKTNLALWRADGGVWRYRLDYRPNNEISFNWGATGDIPTPGDFDGDGITDFAVFRPTDGVWYIRKSSNGSYLFQQFGMSSDKPVASDYNGDGKTDIAVFRPSEGNWYILFSGTQQFFALHFGISEDKPVPEDYDGDGKTDIAVFRPSTGIWYLLKSSDRSFSATQWGISSDIPTPADFDGDGKADLTVFRPTEGNWYILRSFNSQFGSFHFGTSGDIPQVGDWDGNGIMDLGVYRPSTKTWYSSDKTVGTQFGSEGGMPISSILRNY